MYKCTKSLGPRKEKEAWTLRSIDKYLLWLTLAFKVFVSRPEMENNGLYNYIFPRKENICFKLAFNSHAPHT